MNDHETIRILVADDEPDILFTLKAIGRTMGWDVHTAADGREAVNKLRQVKPDLILLDYHMPNQDGLTTVRVIRSLDKIVPIIILTVDERQEVADAFLDAGASDFANKPVKIPDLAARINIHMQLLKKQREMNDAAFTQKGINEATLQLVRQCCRAAPEFFFIEDVADQAGLAYQTTVRYLQYLHSQKELAVVSDYGKVGRPRKKYKCVK